MKYAMYQYFFKKRTYLLHKFIYVYKNDTYFGKMLITYPSRKASKRSNHSYQNWTGSAVRLEIGLLSDLF